MNVFHRQTSVAPSTTTSAVSSTVMNHKSWKRSLESSLNVVAAKQPRFSDVVQVQDIQMTDKKLPIMASGDISQKNIILPPMRMDKKAAISVGVLNDLLVLLFKREKNLILFFICRFLIIEEHC